MNKYFWLLVVLLFTGASAQPVDDEVSLAEQLLNQSPKKSLTLIAQIKSSSVLSIEQQLKVQDMLVEAHRSLGNIALANEELQALKTLAESSDTEFYQARGHRHQAELFYSAGEYAKAEKAHRQALSIFTTIGHDRQIATVTLRLSAALRTQGQYHEAIRIAQQAFNYFDENQDVDGIASTYSAIGLAHEFLGNYTQALSALHKSLALSMQLEDTNGIADSLYNIATIYLETDDLAEARKYFTQALETDSASGHKGDVAYDYIRLAELELKAGNIETGRQHGVAAYQLFEELDSARNQGWARIIQGQIEGADEQYLIARQFLQEGIALAELSKDQMLVTRGTMHLAENAFQETNYDEALKLIGLVENEATGRDNAEQVEFLLETKVKTFVAKDSFKDAFNSLSALREYQAKRKRELQVETIERLQHDIASQAKDHEIALLEKDKMLAQASAEKAKFMRNSGIAGVGMLLVLMTILALKEREKRKLAKVEQQLLQETAKQKDALLADVSHELRTPLTILKLHIECLEHDLSENPKETYLTLNNKIAELNKLIDDIYQLTQSDNGALDLHCEAISPAALLEQVVNQHRPFAEKTGLTLTLDADIPAPVTVEMDALRIEQVITNLLSNSVAYTDSPGNILLKSRIMNGHWQVEVLDSAPAVGEQDWDRLFDRLYRCESSRSRRTGGSGLGLSIAKSLVEAHGGSIKVFPSDLGGVRVAFSIPVNSKQGN